MRAPPMLPANIDVARGRQGREGRDFLSTSQPKYPTTPQPKYPNNNIRERRPRTYACEGNSADIFSRPSRPTRPGATAAGLHCALGGSHNHLRRCHRPPAVVHRMSLAAEIVGGGPNNGSPT
jgi:hypothetical protein